MADKGLKRYLFSMLLTAMTASSLASESQQKYIPLNQTEYSDSLPAETALILNPLVAESEPHGTVFYNHIDTQHSSYPVKIISIDGFELTDDIVEISYRLTEGTHNLILKPDFTHVFPKAVFMNKAVMEKQISFNIKQEQVLTISARITDLKEMNWEVEIYEIELPVEIQADKEENSDITNF